MDSPTDTVIALRLPASAPSSATAASPVPFPWIPTQLSATSPEPEPSPSIVTSSRRSAWSLMGKTRRRGEKEEEKRRKKEEARARKGQLAVDLRGREEAQQRVDGASFLYGHYLESQTGGVTAVVPPGSTAEKVAQLRALHPHESSSASSGDHLVMKVMERASPRTEEEPTPLPPANAWEVYTMTPRPPCPHGPSRSQMRGGCLRQRAATAPPSRLQTRGGLLRQCPPPCHATPRHPDPLPPANAWGCLQLYPQMPRHPRQTIPTPSLQRAPPAPHACKHVGESATTRHHTSPTMPRRHPLPAPRARKRVGVCDNTRCATPLQPLALFWLEKATHDARRIVLRDDDVLQPKLVQVKRVPSELWVHAVEAPQRRTSSTSNVTARSTIVCVSASRASHSAPTGAP
ncbi:hypothetical protein BC826DRAFT_1110407 [Russula brevipes]|nr:hypothetical protein BC826DRAFT_1110407 [Russula brevipes]